MLGPWIVTSVQALSLWCCLFLFAFVLYTFGACLLILILPYTTYLLKLSTSLHVTELTDAIVHVPDLQYWNHNQKCDVCTLCCM